MESEHSKAVHDKCVLKLCRVCGDGEKVRSEKRNWVYLCQKFSEEISIIFDLNISLDEAGKHPSRLCNQCYKKINSRRKQGGKPQNCFISSEEKVNIALLDSKWCELASTSSVSSCFSCNIFFDQTKGGRPKPHNYHPGNNNNNNKRCCLNYSWITVLYTLSTLDHTEYINFQVSKVILHVSACACFTRRNPITEKSNKINNKIMPA